MIEKIPVIKDMSFSNATKLRIMDFIEEQVFMCDDMVYEKDQEDDMCLYYIVQGKVIIYYE